MKNKLKLFLLPMLMPFGAAHALIDRTLVLEGRLIQFDSKEAVLENLTGRVRVPVESVKRFKYQAGQNVLVCVDIADFLQLNKDLLAKNGIKMDSEKAKTND